MSLAGVVLVLDPVNASSPLDTMTAFHSLISLKRLAYTGNYFMSNDVYIKCDWYFLVRSGILNSVHTFASVVREFIFYF